MPKGRTKKNYDALGSIFDFIFQEAEKPVDKRRPVPPTGISAEGEFSDALISTLEKPGAFVSNTLIKEFNDALDVKLLSLDFNNQGKINISANNIVDVIRDPGAFVDKAIQRAKTDRKASRVRFLGEAMDDFLITSWAHKYGDTEAREIALANASANQDIRKERHKISRAIGQSVRYSPETQFLNSDFIIDRSIELIGRRTFGSNWDTLSESQKSEFSNLLSGFGPLSSITRSEIELDKFVSGQKKYSENPSVADVQKYLVKNFGKKEAQAFARAVDYSNPKQSVDISDPQLYKSLERNHLAGKIGALGNPAVGTDDYKKKLMYQKNLNFVNLQTRDQIRDLKEKINDIKELAKKKRMEQTIADEEIAKIQKAIDDGETALRFMGGKMHNIVNVTGRLEGYLNSLNTVWGGVMGAPNLIPSILNGDFFDSRKNTLNNPVEEKAVTDSVKIYMAKYTKGRTFSNAYNKIGETVYYLTPRSIMRTFFFNGEGFALLMRKRLNFLEDSKIFDLMRIDGNIGGKKMTSDDILKIYSQSPAEVKKFVEKQLDFFKSRLTDKQYKQLEKLLKSSSRYHGLFHFFGRPARFKAALDKLVQKRARRIRARLLRVFTKNKRIREWLVKKGVLKLFGTWVAKGGVKNLVKAFVTTIMGALGQTLTPVGSIIVSALTWVLTDLIMKLTKFAMQIAIWMMWGFIAIAVLIFSGGLSLSRKSNKRAFSYNYVPPNAVNKCMPMSPLDDPETPIPIIGSCILGEGYIPCSQGWDINASWSNQICFSHNYPGMHVDLTNVSYIYAPDFCDDSGSECRIVSSTPWYCGTDGKYAGDEIVFSFQTGEYTFTFNFLHVKLLPGFSAGSSLSSGAFAYVQGSDEIDSGNCWSGKHLHIEYGKVNGTAVSPLDLLLAFDCDVPEDVSQCASCNGGGGEVDLPFIDLPESGENPYAQSITSSASQITGFLGKGYWNFYNKPLPAMPQNYSHQGANLIWSQDKYEMWLSEWQYLPDYGVSKLNSDIYSLYWCTWLTYKSYVAAGVPNANSVLAYFGVSGLKSSFSSAGNGYSFISNTSGIVNSISPGDVIFYSRGSTDAHVGIVKSVSSNTITTLESNASRLQSTLTVNGDGSISGIGDLSVSGFGIYR